MSVERSVWRRCVVAVALLGASACAQQSTSERDRLEVLTPGAWIDATATLDPAATPVYEGDAPMSFEFLKDMRKGDGFTLSKLSLGAHSGTHIEGGGTRRRPGPSGHEESREVERDGCTSD